MSLIKAIFCTLIIFSNILLSELPNYVIFFVDDMGYGDVGFTGHPSINTPNIDKLAHEGIILSTWYTGQPVCSPSRAAMLTGRLPVRSGCAGTWNGGVFGDAAIGGLPTNETTFASVLSKAGYKTKMIGKWHLGQRSQFQPQNHGFDESFWIPYSVDMGSSVWLNNGALPLPLLNNSNIIQQPVDLSKVSDLYIQEATQFIQKSVKENKPFVLYMAHSHVHVPDFTNEKYCNSSIRGRFGDAVQEVDYTIGGIYNAIESAGISDNTLTFFTADNGPWLAKNLAGGSAGLFYMGKFSTWEGGMRQPGFAHWPGKIKPNTRSTEVVSTMDIFVTMINIANATEYLPNDGRLYDGKDMSDIIFDNNGGKSKHDCYYMYGGAINATDCPFPNVTNPKHEVCSALWAVRCYIDELGGSYKAHWVTRFTNQTISVQDPPLLFNIDWDPSEMHPISTKNKHYDSIINYLSQKRNANLATIKPVTNQMLLGQNKDYELCADPDSKSKYPNYPNCTMTTEGYTGFVCDPVCYDEDDCKGGEPIQYNGPIFGSIYSDDPVYNIYDDRINDRDIYVTMKL